MSEGLWAIDSPLYGRILSLKHFHKLQNKQTWEHKTNPGNGETPHAVPCELVHCDDAGAMNTAKGEASRVGPVAWTTLDRAGQEWARVRAVARSARAPRCCGRRVGVRCAADAAWGPRAEDMRGGPARAGRHRCGGGGPPGTTMPQALPHLPRGGGGSPLMGVVYTGEMMMNRHSEPLRRRSTSLRCRALGLEGRGPGQASAPGQPHAPARTQPPQG